MLCLFFRHVLDRLFVRPFSKKIIFFRVPIYNIISRISIELDIFAFRYENRENMNLAAYQFSKIPVLMYLLTTIIITMSLFYVDERLYNFNWMQSAGNWVTFFIYGTSIFIGQIMVFLFITKVLKLRNNNLVSVVLGAALAVLILMTLVFR